MRDEVDPKGLIEDSFRISGISEAECRSIFLDWALSLPAGWDARIVLAPLIEKYEADNCEHPMIKIMREGLLHIQSPRRRGGWRGRQRN